MDVFIRRADDVDKDVRKLLESVSWKNIIKNDAQVLIKPNFCTEKFKDGVTTNLQVINAVINTLEERTENIIVGETHSEWKNFETLMKNFNLDYDLVDLSRDETVSFETRRGSLRLPRLAIESVIVNVPILKTHHLTTLTAGMKNLFGLIQDKEKSKYHYSIHGVIVDILEILKPQINILDAIYSMDGYGPTEGSVRHTNFLMASNDALALDLAVCEITGVNPDSVKYLKLASEKYTPNYALIYENMDKSKINFRTPNKLFTDRLAVSLLHYGATRKILMNPTVYKYAKKINSLLRRIG